MAADHFETLVKMLTELEEVEAIALGGSRASGSFDEKSDYDLYVYVTVMPDETIRKKILDETCQYIELNNQFWETEDDCTLKNGIDIDILYRNLDDFARGIETVVGEHQASCGYTTCMWNNLENSKILFDRNGRLRNLQKQYNIEYPERLRQNIIRKNAKLLNGALPSYDAQIRKAVLRNDRVSMNHRAAAYLESYFDLLFALNYMSHPGEKRMKEKLLEKAVILPEHFEENLEAFLTSLQSDPKNSLEILDAMNRELLKLSEVQNSLS